MKYIFTPLLGLLIALVSAIVAPIGMLFAVWFIRWDETATETVIHWSTGPGDPNESVSRIRGDLPRWLRWFQTPDERFPCAMYEPAMLSMLDTRGKLFASYWWAGWRNQLMGMAAAFGKPATDFIPESAGYWERDDIWRYSLPVGPIRIVVGWQVTKLLDGSFLAVPVATLKRS